jgi:polysaccharide export outer membrane protein
MSETRPRSNIVAAVADAWGLRRRSLLLGVAGMTITGCAAQPPDAPTYGAAPRASAPNFANIGYATWRDDEPPYRIYPGDVLDVSAPSAPELNRTVTVEPDGRISLPLIGVVMAADRTVPDLAQTLTHIYSGQLVRPEIDVDVKTATPLRVFVGGEVGKPGVYDMPGDINALQAVILAGGFTPNSRLSQVVIIRRGPGGRAMMRTVDLHNAIFSASLTDAIPLRRLDVIYVPRTGLANLAFMVQALKNIVPVQFSYAIGPNNYATVP